VKREKRSDFLARRMKFQQLRKSKSHPRIAGEGKGRALKGGRQGRREGSEGWQVTTEDEGWLRPRKNPGNT